MKRWTMGIVAASFVFALASSGFAAEANEDEKAQPAPETMTMKKRSRTASMDRMALMQRKPDCRVPVLVTLKEGKIVVEPDPAWIYWGTAIDFHVIAEEGEKVTLVFKKDPFKDGHQPAEYAIVGAGKIKTDKSFRPKELGAPGKTLAERHRMALEFKYSVKWSGGRVEKWIEIDPAFWLVDP
jgi:hypothetical protein